MKTLFPVLAAAALALAASVSFAQGGPGYGPGGGQGMSGPGMMGRQGMDPARREQMKAAYEACKDKPNRQACMSEQVCAKSPDPAKCQAQSKERQARMSKHMDDRQAMHEACNGKRGEDLTKCMQGQHQAQRNKRVDERQKAHEACNGKRGDELTKCLGEQHEKLGYGPHRRG